MWGCSGVSAMTEQLREGSGVLVGLLCTTCTTVCCRRALCVKEGMFRGGLCVLHVILSSQGSLCEGGGI